MIIEIHIIIIKACRRQATNRQPYRWQEKNINDEILQNSCILYKKNNHYGYSVIQSRKKIVFVSVKGNSLLFFPPAPPPGRAGQQEG